MDLLLFFALPIATIILAIVFQKIIKSPILVAATTFAIYLIVTFTAFDSSFLVYAIIYTILAYIAAYLSKYICENINRSGFFKNINAESINTNTLNANSLETNVEENNGCCLNNRKIEYRNRGWR